MKKILLVFAALMSAAFVTQAQNRPQYKVITVVESIVPAGIGRSRMIETKTEFDIEDFTTERTDGTTSEQKNIKRKDAKADEFEESKMLNFYSVTGINFQNIASNDALITSKLNQLSDEGWDLLFVTSGVESDSGKEDGNGIYITRFVFKRIGTSQGD